MSNSKKKIAIYENLPSGGARLTYETTSKYLSKYFQIRTIDEPKYSIDNILKYLYISLIDSPKYQKRWIEATAHDLLLVYHSWMVKSPNILRYTSKPKIYICHEPLREYYDKDHVRLQSFKEKLVNFLRVPIMFMDRINIHAEHTYIVANSEYSKQLIDKTYNVNSEVIYPGINTKKYRSSARISKRNQVISVGSINKLKNQSFLIDVISRISQSIRPSLVLIGNGLQDDYYRSLKVKASILKVKLEIMINVTDSVKIRELKRSKVFMYSPVNEPFGLVVEEALAAGLPILTYSHGGGFNEIIDSRNGIILNKLDSGVWSKNLQNMLLDSKYLTNTGRYNSMYAKKYLDSEIMNKKIVNLINKII